MSWGERIFGWVLSYAAGFGVAYFYKWLFGDDAAFFLAAMIMGSLTYHEFKTGGKVE